MREPARITVVKPGWLTTVQDLGRYGYQQYGMPVSGTMDRRSFVLANRLLGNRDDAAALEITLKGPELLFEQDAIVAITGADLSPSVNGSEIPLWISLSVKAGQSLSFGARCSGARCYLAVAGGINVPIVLGSRSTHIASKTGGLKGRALMAGDVLAGGLPLPHQRQTIGRSWPKRLRSTYSPCQQFRILPGPQRDAFTVSAMEVLTSHAYRLSSQSDRMGYRLEGPSLALVGQAGYISDGTAMGTLQVPQNGQPILLMADRQTTGGYPKIAVVITADLPLAGQLLPGDEIQFAITTLEEARTALRTQWEDIQQALPPFDATAP